MPGTTAPAVAAALSVLTPLRTRRSYVFSPLEGIRCRPQGGEATPRRRRGCHRCHPSYSALAPPLPAIKLVCSLLCGESESEDRLLGRLQRHLSRSDLHRFGEFQILLQQSAVAGRHLRPVRS